MAHDWCCCAWNGVLKMLIEKTGLPGVLILTPPRHSDPRGFFSETYNARTLQENGIETEFVQDNHSLSVAAGVVRGLHFQAPPHAQAKLVRVGAGAIMDVAVDIRKGSPAYGKWAGVKLSAANGRQLLIPQGFLHGFATLEPRTEVLYKCSDYYMPNCDGSVHFASPSINIDWGIDPAQAIISDKDKGAVPFHEFDSPFIWSGEDE